MASAASRVRGRATKAREIIDEALAASRERAEKLMKEISKDTVHDEVWKRDCEDRALWGDY